MAHKNDGSCQDCLKIIHRYPNFNETLLTWFQAMQLMHEDLHTSCAGRGMVDQEAAFARGASKAHWLHSAHNFNCALDLFQLKDGKYTLDEDWFRSVVGANIYPSLMWLGERGSSYYELPHIELTVWPSLVKNKTVVSVE